MADRHIISDAISIDAPPQVVFDILADARQHPRIDGSGSVQEVLEAPERLSRGAEFTVSMRLGAPYKITNRVVEYDEGRRIAWRHFGGHRWRYELEPVGEGTRVTESFDYSRFSAPKARLMELLRFPQRNREGITQTLQRLKTAAEADSGAAQAPGAGDTPESLR